MTYGDIRSTKQIAYAKRIAAALDGSFTQLQLRSKVGLRRKENLLYVTVEPAAAHGELPGADVVLPVLKTALLHFKPKLDLGWIKQVQVIGQLGLTHRPAHRPFTTSAPAAIWQASLLPGTATAMAEKLMQQGQAIAAQIAQGDQLAAAGNLGAAAFPASRPTIVEGERHAYAYQHCDRHGGALYRVLTPQVTVRRGPVAVRPYPIEPLRDRQTVLPVVREALSQGQPVELYANAGFGKTTLAAHLAYDTELTDLFADGVVYLAVEHQDAEEILQNLYQVFYTSTLPLKPNYEAAARSLQGKQALLFLDGLSLTPGDTERLLAALPNCAVMLVSQARFYRQAQTAIALKGLPFPDALKMLEEELGRVLSDLEQQAAKRLWTALSGNPLQLRRTAAYVRTLERVPAPAAQQTRRQAHSESVQSTAVQSTAAHNLAPASDESPFAHFIQSVQTVPGKTLSARSLFNTIARNLARSHQQVLALMGAMGGAALSVEAVETIAQQPNSAGILADLAALHLIKPHPASDDEAPSTHQYALCADLKDWVTQLFEAEPWLLSAIAYFTATSTALRRTDTAAQLHLLEWTQRTGRWQQSLALAQQLDSPLALAGQWCRWQQILAYHLQAAEQLGDGAAEAWALHQLGTQALATDKRPRAAAWLSRALRLREKLKDTDGAALSRHNLSLLTPQLVSGQGAPRGAFRAHHQHWRQRTKTAASGLALVGTALAGLVLWPRLSAAGPLRVSDNAITFGSRTLESTTEPKRVTLTNESEQLLKLEEITVSGDQDFGLSRPGGCEATLILAPGENCDLLAVFEPEQLGKRTAQVTVISRIGDRQLSHKIALQGTGSEQRPFGISFSPDFLDFGKAVLERQARQSFKLTNDGSSPLTVVGLETVGRHATDFGLLQEGCMDTTLEPGESCSVDLWFAPSGSGDRTARLLVSSKTGEISELYLEGRGVSGKPTGSLLPPFMLPPNATENGTSENDATETLPAAPGANGETAANQMPASNGAALPASQLVARDDRVVVAPGSRVMIDVLGNDNIPPGETLPTISVNAAGGGSTEVQGNQVVYTHAGAVAGDRFTYQIQTAAGQTAIATVVIEMAGTTAPEPEFNGSVNDGLEAPSNTPPTQAPAPPTNSAPPNSPSQSSPQPAAQPATPSERDVPDILPDLSPSAPSSGPNTPSGQPGSPTPPANSANDNPSQGSAPSSEPE